jgi:hypothetical protein
MTIDVNDIIGKKFGRLTVLELDHVCNYTRPNGRIQKQYYYICQCSCENKTIVVVNRADLTRSTHPTRSCGCLVSELGKSNTKHGMSNTRFYHIWQGMIQRCCNENSVNYSNYGAKGVTVCEAWRQDFQNFYNDMYESYLEYSKIHGEENTTLDRKDPFGNYEPSNCQWLDHSGQNSNKKKTEFFTYQGQEYTKKQLYDEFSSNLSWNGFCRRLNKLESNEIVDLEIFYHYESPIIDLHKYFTDDYLPTYVEKLNKQKEEARIALVERMRKAIEADKNN